jgi:hypothetical protein
MRIDRFTEGTDLFSKGDLLYSRRIGGRPNNQPTVAENETIIENPSSVDLINALKVSGRTKGGLGIGILNAVTKGHLQQLKTKTLKKQEEKRLNLWQITMYLF